MAKKYDVYGIGNALVDIVTEVEDDFFKQHDIEKGLMTLVDEDRQHHLMQAIHLPNSHKQGGGSAANTVVAASQFGGTCYYSCKVADDEMGHFFLEDLKNNGVDTNLSPQTLPSGITGKCLVMTTPDADRTMNTFLGITSALSTEEIDEEALKNASYLYMEGYLITSENGRDAMKRAKKVAEAQGVKTALTFSDPSMVKYFKPELTSLIGDKIDLLFCNEEEAMLFTDTDTLLQARESLKNYASRFAITLGSNGATIFDGITFVDIEPYKVEAIDTNGAGDMFAGAFLYGITHGHSCADSGKLASLAASQVVSRFGPRLKWHQAQEILNHLVEN